MGIRIDGELDEPAWTNAVRLEPLVKNDGSGKATERTEVRLCYDDQALYVAWICEDRDILATFTNRDSHFWEEEVVEFFAAPASLNRYFELQWSPLGGVFDAVITNRLAKDGLSKGFAGDWSFTARGMKSAVKLRGTVNDSSDRDEFWQVEIRLPFADLNQPCPPPGTVWRGNFYRFDRTKGLPVEELSWSPTWLPGFHEPSRFGYLEFGGPSAAHEPARARK